MSKNFMLKALQASTWVALAILGYHLLLLDEGGIIRFLGSIVIVVAVFCILYFSVGSGDL